MHLLFPGKRFSEALCGQAHLVCEGAACFFPEVFVVIAVGVEVAGVGGAGETTAVSLFPLCWEIWRRSRLWHAGGGEGAPSGEEGVGDV